VLTSEHSHGWYSISIDSGEKQYFDGYSEKDQLQSVLYATTGLGVGNHEVVLCNEWSDYMPWNASMGGVQRVCKSTRVTFLIERN
jgi:hypothetical protein